MATTRIKDISKTTTDLASDTYIVADGATNGTQKMARNDAYADWAAAYVAAPTTYKLAPLNGSNKIDATYLPTSGDTPKGEWNANTNSPALADGAGTAGDYYDVTTAGTQNLGSGNITFTVGDVVKYDGSVWYKIDSVSNFLDGYSTAATSRTALEVNSVDEDAEAVGTRLVGPSVYFDGTNDYIEVADDAKLSFTDGTDDLPFSICAWIKPADATSFPILTKYGTSTATREWGLRINASDDLKFIVIDTSGNNESVESTSALTGYEGEWVHIAATYGGAGPNSDSAFTAASDEMTLYVNGAAVASSASDSGTYTGMSDTSQAMWIGRYNSDYADGHIRDVRLFNRELTAAEVASLARSGTSPNEFADEWAGTVGGVYTQDATPSGEWSDTRATVADEAGPIGGVSNVLKVTVTDTTNATHFASLDSLLTVGKRYRVTGRVYIPSGQSNVDGFRIGVVGDTTLFADEASPTLDSWVNFSAEGVTPGSTLLFYAMDNGVTTFQDSGGDDVYYIDSFTVTEIGTLADFRAEGFDPDTDTWQDSGGNNYTGQNSGAVLTGRPHPWYYTTSFTPSVEFGGGNTGLTVSASEGYVTRIGRTAHVYGRIILSAKGSSTGTAKITGLPYNGKNVTVAGSGLTVSYMANMASLNSTPSLLVDDAGTEATLYHLDQSNGTATGSTAITHANFTDTTDIRFSGTYIL